MENKSQIFKGKHLFDFISIYYPIAPLWFPRKCQHFWFLIIHFAELDYGFHDLFKSNGSAQHDYCIAYMEEGF